MKQAHGKRLWYYKKEEIIAMTPKELKLHNENKLLKQQNKLKNRIDIKNNEHLLSNSDLTSRLSLQGQITKTHNNKRNLYNVFGYDQQPKIDDYINRYLRQDIAKRIIESYPNACWAESPNISDDQDTEDITEFEEAYNDLAKNPKIKLFHYLRRLDIVAGLGHYGILFIGVKDGKKTIEPLDSQLNIDDILFFAPYSEKNATISKYDEDPQSERFGLPLIYNLNAGGYGGTNSTTASQIMKRETIQVHYTRVIHVAEGVLENDVLGTPRLEPIVNRLIDLEKIVGGGSEIFFLNARGGIHMNQQPETKLTNSELLETRMQEFTHSTTRYLRTKGIDVSTLNFDIADPKNYFEMIISLISATTGIPKRILTGSEQAQLASSQDQNHWLTRVYERQADYCEMQVLRPIIDWFIEYGILPEPKDGQYEIRWQDLRTLSELEKAEVAVKTTQAIQNYTNAQGAEMIMPPKQLFDDVLGLEYREDDLPNTQDFDEVEEIADGED
jgi:hypothetical protein